MNASHEERLLSLALTKSTAETTWESERPDVAIESLDFISRRTGLMPSPFAITVEL
jgi:hypothetical protein